VCIETHALLKVEALSKLAQHYLGVPGTSAHMEHLSALVG